MEIVTVEFSRLVSTDNYSNIKIGAVANVDIPKGETPDIALENLMNWVDDKLLKKDPRINKNNSTIAILQRAIAEINDEPPF